MATRDPHVRRALVTRLSEDGETAWVLVEWMKALKRRERTDQTPESPEEKPGVPAVALSGLQVGDEVLVDLRPLPVLWLSFLFFVAPILAFTAGATVTYVLASKVALPPAAALGLQVLTGMAGAYATFRYADGYQAALQAKGQGTPVVTAIMPRFMGESGEPGERRRDLLQAVFFLRHPVSDADWQFAAAEFERMSGVHQASIQPDRVEVVFQSGVIKEKHLFELLTMLNFPVEVGHDPDA